MNMMTPENLNDLKKNAEVAENPTLKRMMKAWESKQAKNARKAGGLGLVAVSLAACGGSSSSSDGGGTTPEPTTGQTFPLTTGVDTFTGGDGDDVFNAFAVQTAFLPNQTLGSNDVLIGGAGRDTLNVELVTGFTAPASLESIEVVNILGSPDLITSLLGGLLGVPSILDVINADSIDTIGFRMPVNSVIVDNLQTALDTVNITDSTLGNFYVINHIGDALDGDSDVLNINLSNVSSFLLGSPPTVLQLDGDGGTYETANINSGGPVTNTFVLGVLGNNAAGEFETINVAGSQDLNIAGASLSFGSLRLFDATGLNADLSAAFFGNAGADTVTLRGAQGDNTFAIGNTTANLVIETFGGDDAITIGTHTGNVSLDADAGNNTVAITDVTGSVTASAGAGNDTFTFTTVSGDVTVDGGDGTNTYRFEAITGDVTATGGAGMDTFTFVSTGAATFGPGDSVDGGAGDDVLIIQAGGALDQQLLVAGVGSNIVNIETIRHQGEFTANDLLVDMGRSGSATRLELTGTYADDVRISNLDYDAGDVVAVMSSIADDLQLTNAALTPGAYRLEIGNSDPAGVTIGDDLIVGDGLSDLLILTSVGIGPNVITDVDQVDAQVRILGDEDQVLRFGSAGDAYDLDNGVIDTTGFTGTVTVFLGTGNQTFVGGDGNDIVWSVESGFGDHNQIELGGGNNNAVGFDETSPNGFFSGQIQNQHTVTGFTVGEDSVVLKVGGGGDSINLESSENLLVTNLTTVAIRNIESGNTENLSATNVNFLKFTTAQAMNATDSVDDLFDAAIGAGSITVGAGADMLGAAYDTTSGSMVLFRIDNGGGIIDSADTAFGIVNIEMSYAEFLDFGTNDGDLNFVNSYV